MPKLKIMNCQKIHQSDCTLTFVKGLTIGSSGINLELTSEIESGPIEADVIFHVCALWLYQVMYPVLLSSGFDQYSNPYVA